MMVHVSLATRMGFHADAEKYTQYIDSSLEE